MILRRIASSIRKQDWFVVILEILIVVLGVFIGIEVANWNEARQEHAAEHLYLDRMLSDLDGASNEVANQIAFELEISDMAAIALKLIDEPPSDMKRQELAAALSFLSSRRTLVISSPTFLELQSSGQLSLIRDQDLRDATIAYFGRADRVENVFSRNAEQFVDQGFAAYLRDAGFDAREWDQQLKIVPRSSIIDSAASLRIYEQRFDGHLLHSSAKVLMSPSDAAIWEDLRVQLSWRATTAINHELMATEFAALTSETRAAIAAYLDNQQ